MTTATLLRPVRLAGRFVYEAIGSSPLAASGNSISIRLDKSVLDAAGLVDTDRGPVDGVEASLTYRLDSDESEVTIEATLPIQDDAPVNRWLQEEEEFAGAEAAAGRAD